MKLHTAILPAALLALASCKSGKDRAGTTPPAPSTPSVAITAKQPSPHFQHVMQQLDVGGKSLHFEDHEGRREFWIGLIKLILSSVPKEQLNGVELDAAKLVDTSGMAMAAASGRSLSKDDEGWLMRHYTSYPGGLPPMTKAMLGDAKPLLTFNRLPAASDITLESYLTATTFPQSIRDIGRMMGEAEKAEASLKEALPIGMSLEELLSRLDLHVLLAVDIDNTLLPQMPVMPKHFLLEITTRKDLLEQLMPMVGGSLGEAVDVNGRKAWLLPIPPLPGLAKGKPHLIHSGDGRLSIVSSLEYFNDVEGSANKLKDDPAFQAATNHFSTTGHFMAYASPAVAKGAYKWAKSSAEKEAELKPLIDNLGPHVPKTPWSLQVIAEADGIRTTAEMPVAIEADSITTLTMLSATSTLFVGARAWKKGSDRAAVIMNIRNCQQAMRGEQNMKQLKPGDPFTRKDLEQYMKFPEDIKVTGGWIRFEPGDKITPESGDPATNDNHIWLKVTGPGMDGVVGEHGFKDISETTGW